MGILKKISGWKTVVSYLLLSIPGVTDTPMLKAAIDAVIASSTPENIITLIVQAALFLGVGDRVRKNLASKR